MNTFTKAAAVVLTAVSLAGLATSQAFAWDNCEHDNSYSYQQQSYNGYDNQYNNGYNEYQPSYNHQYGYGHHYHRSHNRYGW
jgi:hypothetical protein